MKSKNALLIFGSIIVLVGSALWYANRRKKLGEESSDKSPISPSPESKPKGETKPQEVKPKAPSAPNVDEYLFAPYLVMAFQDWMDVNHSGWVKGKNLNKKSGYGNLGPSTRTAWSKYGNEYARYQAEKGVKIMAENEKQAIMTKFPIGKNVMAAVAFRTPASELRNNSWLTTDTNGNTLPSREYKKTADVGSVHGYSTSVNGGILIVLKLKTPIEGETNDGITRVYNYMVVKPTWII